jgi:hypothetical protein
MTTGVLSKGKLLDAARRYNEKGWRPFPVTDSGVPSVRWGELRDREPTDDELEEWFSRRNVNAVAIPTGKESGIVAIDIDHKKGKDGFGALEYAGIDVDKDLRGPTIHTPNGGIHVLFKHPGGDVIVPTRTDVGGLLGVDVLGDGGNVKLDGDGYVWDETRNLDTKSLPALSGKLKELVLAPVTVETLTRRPVDWDAPLPEITPLFPPYLYAAHRTWVWGPTESGKSLWVQWVCSRLSLAGKKIVYVQQENSLPVERLRWQRLGADLDHVDLYHDQGYDLVRPEDVDDLVTKSDRADLVVLDTLTSCWSGDENSNSEIAAFDRNVMVRLKDDVGCAVIVIHHAGHPSQGRKREPASMGRGASSQGQKADTILEIKTDHRFSQGTFNIIHGKNRPGGGVKEPVRRFEIVDLEDGGLDILPDDRSLRGRLTRKQEEARQRVREFLEERGPEGATQSKIAKRTEVSTNTLYKVLEAMEMDGELAPHKKRAPYALAELTDDEEND